MRRAAAAVALLASGAALALAGTAQAQVAVTEGLQAPPPAAATTPEPLWVPDPEPDAVAGELTAADVPAADIVARAQAQAIDAVPAADDPARIAIAQWLAAGASAAGLPGELAVMAALVESGLRNLPYGDRDSVGYFQMRLSIWDSGPYQGYLARPELQLRWFVDHALAIQAARVAAGDATFGADPATWGAWVADVEQPDARYRGRYQERLAEAQALLAVPAPSLAPFELALTVGGPAQGVAPADELAARVLADDRIELDERAREDLVAGRVDPRLSAVLLEAAAHAPITVTVIQTGHSYRTRNGSVSNHSFGRAADIGAVGAQAVGSDSAAAQELALALAALPSDLRPTEIGTPWTVEDPAYFTDDDHQNHLHVGFDDALGAATASAGTASVATEPSQVPVIVPTATRPRRPALAPSEPRFAAAERARGDAAEPHFEARGVTP